MDAVVAFPGGVVVAVEGEAGGDAEPVCKEDVEARDGAEAVAVEVGDGGVDSIGLFFVGSELANQIEDERHVLRRGHTDLKGSIWVGLAHDAFDGIRGTCASEAG